MTGSERPVPVPDRDDEFFWESLGRWGGGSDELRLPLCGACQFVWLRPIPACPRCGSADIASAPQAAAGAVYSWVVVNRALDPAFTQDAPYTVVTVELECGARMIGRLLGDVPPRAGMSVRLELLESGGAKVPGFRPLEQKAAR
jgi:uncharacterized OB-fold protein